MLGPMQLDILLSQDETISRELGTLNVSGTKIIKNMTAVPINNTVLYIESIDDLVDAIIKANGNLENSANNSDWEMIGKDLKKLQELINKMEILQQDKKKQEEQNKINANNITNEVNIINSI